MVFHAATGFRQNAAMQEEKGGWVRLWELCG
jgi:hypothetical protein